MSDSIDAPRDLDLAREAAPHAEEGESGQRGLARFVRFGLVGGSGVLVNALVVYLVFWLLGGLIASEDARFTAANTCGVVVSIFTNFLLNDAWTWGDRVKGGRGAWARRLVRYYATCGVAGVVQITVASLSFRLLFAPLAWSLFGVDLSKMLSVLVGIAAGILINFPVSHLWAFKDEDSP